VQLGKSLLSSVYESAIYLFDLTYDTRFTSIFPSPLADVVRIHHDGVTLLPLMGHFSRSTASLVLL
jgi:hypothetical protein